MTDPGTRASVGKRVTDRRDLLLEAGLALASELSLPIVLQRIVDLAVEVTDARYGALGVLAEDGTIAEFITSGISARARARIGAPPRGAGILGVLIHDSEPLRLADIASDPRSVGFPANHPPMRSFMGAPVRAMGRNFGNIYLTEKRAAPEFSADDMEHLLVLATQAGVAIANASLYEEAKHRERWLHGLRAVTLAILSASDQESVLQMIATSARELADADTASIVLPSQVGGHLTVAAASGRHADRLRGLEVPIEGSISGAVVLRGSALRLADAATDPRSFKPMVSAARMGPAIFAPLRVGASTLGALSVSNVSGGRALPESAARLVESFAEQAAIAYDYGRSRRDAERLAIMDERERIARDMHDGIIQSLFAVGMRLEAVAAGAGGDVEDRIGRAVGEIDRVIRDLRNYIFALRPGLLADRQLEAALTSQAEDFESRTGIATVVKTDPEVAQTLSGRSADLVQLVTEALSNIARHAQARHVDISLATTGASAVLTIADDGVGFDLTAATRGQGLGNLEDRVRRMGGRLRITSRPGRGTRVRATLPLR